MIATDHTLCLVGLLELAKQDYWIGLSRWDSLPNAGNKTQTVIVKRFLPAYLFNITFILNSFDGTV